MNKKRQYSERGAAHLLLLILLVLVIGAVAATGYIVVRKHTPLSPASPNTAATVTNTAAAAATNSTCLAAYHDATLCKFAANSTSLDKMAYTANLTVTQNGSTSTMTLASDGKGNSKLSSTDSGAIINSITLDGNTYIQSSGSVSWIEYPSGASAPTSDPTNNMNIGVGSTGITFKASGTQSCGSLTCYKYQVSDTSMPNTKQYVLFDNGSYKLREWQYTDASGNTTTMDVSYESVNITAPSPVQQLGQ